MPRSSTRLASRLTLIALPILFAACGPTSIGSDPSKVPPDMRLPIVDQCGDFDGDHYNIMAGCPNGLPGGDCDDHDPLTYPGAAEICHDHKAQNCNYLPDVDATCDDDGDGYAIVATATLPGGDCRDDDRDDQAKFISPGSYEITVDDQKKPQGVDDNCNGQIDEETPTCDKMLKGGDATTFANAIEVCAPWLKSAEWNRLVDKNQKKITDHFGMFPKQSGENMAFMSTGIAADEKDFGYTPPQPGTQLQGRENNPLVIKAKNVCSGYYQASSSVVNDMAQLKMTIKVPNNAKAIQFRFNFFSAEYAEYVGNQYNDMFIAKLSTKRHGTCAKDDDCKTMNNDTDNQGVSCDPDVGSCSRNVSFDASGQPITVNSDVLFQVCKASPICQNKGHKCAMPVSQLNGSGYESLDATGEPFGGATGWLVTTAPVTPGETINLTLFIFDGGDNLWDSAVLIDSFNWLFDDAVTGTIPG